MIAANFLNTKLSSLYNHKVFKNFSSLLLSNIFMQLFNMGAVVLIARVFTPVEYGLYTYMIIQAILIATISEFGFRHIAIREIARNNDSKSDYFSLGLIISISCNIILLFPYWLYNDFFGSFTLSQIALLMCYSLNLCIYNTTERVFIGLEKVKQLSVSNVLHAIFWLLGVFLLKENFVKVETLFLFYLFLFFFKTLFLLFILNTKFNVKFKINGIQKLLFQTIKQCLPFFGIVLVALPANYLANNFLEINSTYDEVGLFSLSNKFISPVFLALNVLLSVFLPNISQLWASDKQKFDKSVSKAILFFIGLGGLLVFIISLLLPYFIKLLFSDKYYGAILILEWQLWYIYFFGVVSFIGTVLAAINMEKLSFKMAIINMLIMTPLLWYGSFQGGKGLALNYLLGISVFSLILWVVFLNTLKLSYRLSFVWLIPIVLLFVKLTFI